jgi:glycosyltransferase involved in cell wall biosynthesis
MTAYSVSCVIPTYNSARYLAEAVESVLAQTLAPAEIIVVDDGSMDDTCRVAASFGSRVRLIEQATIGPPATRNTGIRYANAEYITFLDADDRWHPDKLARQLNRFRAAPPDVCVAMVQSFWMPELNAEYQRLRHHPRAQPVAGYISGTMMARRDVFDRVGLFDERLWFGDSAEWFTRAEHLGVEVALLPDVLLYHRMHDGNISRRRVADSKKEFLQLARERLRGKKAAYSKIPTAADRRKGGAGKNKPG